MIDKSLKWNKEKRNELERNETRSLKYHMLPFDLRRISSIDWELKKYFAKIPRRIHAHKHKMEPKIERKNE